MFGVSNTEGDLDMSTVAKLGVWAGAAAGILYVMFEPTRGLLNQGPIAAAGIALVAAGVLKQLHDTRTPAPARQPAPSGRR